MAMYRIEHYLTADGHKDLYIDWLEQLCDSRARVAVVRRVARIEQGNFEATMRSRPHDEAMAELYRSDPALALEVINGILEDGDQAELLTVLRHMAQAFGGVQAVAEQAQLNPTQLYRTLSPKGNPALSSLSAILRAMGLRLTVQPLSSSTPAHVR